MKEIDINKIYFPLIERNERYINLYGGAGSGKSVFAAQKEIYKSLLRKERILCVRKVQRTLKTSVFRLLQDVVGDWGFSKAFTFNKSDLSIKADSGSEFILLGLDDPEKIKSIQGITRIWIEEATEITEEDFNQLNLRLRGVPNPQITLSYNPIDKHHWLNRRFHQEPDSKALVLKTTYQDNKFLDDEYKSTLEDLKAQDENYYKIYALGEWGGDIKGLIYPNWTIGLPPDNIDDTIYGLDFGFNNPTALIQVDVADGELYVKELVYESGLTNNDLIETIKGLDVGKNDYIYGDVAEPARIEELRRNGFNIKPANKRVGDGIDHVRRYNIHIHPESDNIQTEQRTYKWKERNGIALDEPVKFQDHAIDAIRYAVHSHFSKPQGSWVKNIVSKNKRRR